MKFTITDVQRMADPSTFQRGLDYFKKGRVKDINYLPSAAEFAATVSGSNRNHYIVWVSYANGRLQGDCTCPVGRNCKHSVAAALTWLGRAGRAAQASAAAPAHQPSVEDKLQEWLEALPAPRRSSDRQLISSQHYTLYFLRERSGQLYLELHKGYLKQSGEWSRISSYQPDYYGLRYSPPAHVQPDDVTIIQLLPRDRAYHGLEIKGVAGSLALKHLLATRRFYYDGKVINTAPAQRLAWQWQESAEGYQLLPELSGRKNWFLLDTEPLHFFDADEACIGELESPLDGAQIQHLKSMPQVAQAQVKKVAVVLRQQFSAEQLPLPVAEPEVITVDTASPQITLCRVVTQFAPNIPVARLHFDYGGQELVEPDYSGTEDESVEIVEREGKTLRVVRDFVREEDWIDDFYQLGFALHRDDDDRESVWLPNEDSITEIFAFWRRFLAQTVPELQAQGWNVVFDESFSVELTAANFDFTVQDSSNNWFEFGLSLPVADKGYLDTGTIVQRWLEQGTPDELVVFVEGEWISINTQPLSTVRDLVTELYHSKKLNKPVKLAAFQAAQIMDLPNLDERKAPLTKKLRQQFQDFKGITPVAVSENLNAELRPYQQEGLNWLAFLQHYGLGGILADDMGLGKTLQTLALLQHLKDIKALKKPALIIAPTSLMGNWVHEAERFTPALNVTLIHGPDRAANFKQIKNSDLILTTYPLLVRDKQHYAKQKFSVVILDEAQAIKNPTTKVAQEVRALICDTRLCLTGTPMENHLGELWALMDFVLPGLLSGRKTFQQQYRTPIENQGDTERQRQLSRRVAPFLLRRTKSEVVKELPSKTEILQYVELEGKQRALYESIRVSMEKRIRDLVAQQGMARSHIEFLDALLKLRQACIDPRLVKLDKAAGIKEHAKLDWLNENLPQLLEEGRNILVFSQFTQLLGLIEDDLKRHGIAYTKLTGQTRKRQEAIAQFQSGAVRVFLISLKAGGSGLNLTEADVVIHMDPWWNPAVENQATDRAHRIGQDKPVFVYKLVAADTVEERIQQMQQQKQALADKLFDEANTTGLPQDKDALLALFAP